MKVKSESEVAQSCPTFSNPMDCSPLGPSVHGFPGESTRVGCHRLLHQYSILTHIYGIQKDGNNNLVCETAKETQMYRTVLDSVGEGEGGMIWENGIETCIMSYMKQIASPGLMHDTGCSGLVHWDDLEEWDGREVGRGFRMGNTCTHMAVSCEYFA